MLSPSFQNSMHGGNYADYLYGHQSKGYCSITTSDEKLVQYDGERAVVSTHIVYRMGTNCDAYEYNFDITLVFDESRLPVLTSEGYHCFVSEPVRHLG